ncbi:HAMP domain-containing sensor histidine kinase [Cellulomonas sp.]|uniref:HAMP domain-containing sensor histidine kinase n=1 Tax=Cellulomonas sp. TaxID=40001 RepID=UPI001B04147D|nr:HAMP domain-containing sensor histidine kinase [Cellulomonas sp.]MBO9553397.1 HAMP domain-containing histidine kinase [Cellulomonas sp.]
MSASVARQVPPQGLTLTARITLLSAGVALVAALLGGTAAARFVAAEVRGTATVSTGVAENRADRVADRRAQVVPPRRVVRAVLVSVGVGLVVGVLAGGATARVLTRPLRRTADAARALSAGDRHVRVPHDGPPEVVEVAAALNGLAVALEASEGRQRRFLLAVSHELRTPLTAVRGFAESVADGVVEGQAARDAGHVILAESMRLDRLVQDLLDLARLGADDFRLHPAVVDLGTMLDETTEVWSARAAARGIDWRVERVGAVSVRTDPARLRQVVDGLLENALRLTPPGRPVVLALRSPGERTGPPGTVAVLEVRDGGPGLSAADRTVAFEPGALGARYRDERPVGVGIGLSLVRGLVDLLGGTVTVGDAPEGGARFTVAVAPLPD